MGSAEVVVVLFWAVPLSFVWLMVRRPSDHSVAAFAKAYAVEISGWPRPRFLGAALWRWASGETLLLRLPFSDGLGRLVRDAARAARLTRIGRSTDAHPVPASGSSAARY